MSIKRFQFEFFSGDAGEVFILHNLQPQLKMQLIVDNNFEYDQWHDVFDMLEFNGHEIVLVVKESSVNLDEIEDYSEIRHIIQRALKWYRNLTYIKPNYG